MTTDDERVRILQEKTEKNYQSISETEAQNVKLRSERTRDKTTIGILLCVLSGFFLIGGNTLTKLASLRSRSISSWQLLLLRSVVFIVVLLPVIVWRRIGIFGPSDRSVRLKLIIQAVLANSLIFCYYEGMMRLPLGDYQAIIFSSPVFTMVMSAFLIKDRFGLYRALLALILTSGIIVICRPSSLFPPNQDSAVTNSSSGMLHATRDVLRPKISGQKSTDLIGIGFALAGSIFSSWITIISRQLNTVHFSVQLIWGSIGGVLMSLVVVLSHNSLPGLEVMLRWPVLVWVMSVGQSVLGLAGTISILIALKWITPTKNKVLRSFQVVGSYIIQVELFGTKAHTTDYLGAGLIVLAVLGIAVEDRVVKRLREKFAYI